MEREEKFYIWKYPCCACSYDPKKEKTKEENIYCKTPCFPFCCCCSCTATNLDNK